MFRKYVKSPIDSSGLRLDTVLRASNGDFIYRYTQSVRSLPQLKKVVVNMTGSVWRFGEYICDFPSPDSLEFYISSLSSLADDSPHYRMVIRERVVRDNTLALIDFAVGKSAVDTSLGCNAEELARVRRCIGDVFERDELELDSLVVIAACSVVVSSFFFPQPDRQLTVNAVVTASIVSLLSLFFFIVPCISFLC